MGILDALDSPAFLSQLFGVGGMSDAAPTPPMPMPKPPAGVVADNFPPQQPPQPPSMLPPDFTGSASPGGIGSDAARTPGVPQPSWTPPTPPGPSPAQVVANHFPPPNPGGLSDAAPLPPNVGGISDAAPVPRPQVAMQPSQNPNLVPVAPGQNPPAGAVPMPPASAFVDAPGTETTGRGLGSALGLDPNAVAKVRQQDAIRAAVSGIGKGLSAVGKMPAGATAGQQFAGGLGGGLEGQTEMQQKQKDTLFNQSSQAFKDMMLAKQSDDTQTYRQAQQRYLDARAASLNTMTANGGKGSNAWQNTPYGKVIGVENEVQKYEKGQQIVLQKRWQLNGATQEQQQEDLERLNKNIEAYRGRLYKQAGIDPKQADKIKDMGMSPDNAFDTKGMTLDQFHSQVPMGGWFKDQNGVVRQRTVAPPGSGHEGTPMAAGGGAPGSANNYDDLSAMTPAA